MPVNTNYGSQPSNDDLGLSALDAGFLMPPVQVLIPPSAPEQTDMERSRSAQPSVEFVAAQPHLSAVNTSGPSLNILQQTLAALAIQSDAITQNILDTWSASVAKQAAANKAASERSRLQEQIIQEQLLDKQHVKETIQKQDIDKANVDEKPVSQRAVLSSDVFLRYWNEASSTEKMRISADFLAQHSTIPSNSLSQQLEDAKKVVGPYAAEMVADSVIPGLIALNYANQVATQGVNSQYLPSSISINLLLPIAQTSAAAAFALKKTYEGGPPKTAGDLDREFVLEFAKRMNARVANMIDLIQDPQLGSYATLSALVGIATIFQFDIKSMASASNLSGQELKSLIQQGYPNNDTLNTSLQYLKKILSSLATAARVQYVEILLEYIDKLPKIDIEDLRDFSRVLLYATAEIGRDKRIGSEPT